MNKERILSKIDELDQYIIELEAIKPENYEEFIGDTKIKRACERLLQIAIECIIDICTLIIKELKLGLPSEEGDLFEKLEKKNIITKKMKNILKNMKGFRNILVHRYADIDDELVFENLDNIKDFKEFKNQILSFLRKTK